MPRTAPPRRVGPDSGARRPRDQAVGAPRRAGARQRPAQAVIWRRRAVAIWLLVVLVSFAAAAISDISHGLSTVDPVVHGSALGLARRAARPGFEREQQLGRIEADRILG